jgi:hypothetical protein
MNDLEDFEKNLRRTLNQGIDRQLGPRRQPPVFHPPVRTPRPWLTPLLAAACVAVVVAATFGAKQLIMSKPAHPAAPSLTPTTSLSGTPNTTPTPSHSSGPSHASSGQATPPYVTVHLGAATLQLPTGWQARPMQEYNANGGGPLDPESWCLTPASTPVSTDRYGCPMVFNADLDRVNNPIDSDVEGGYDSNPEYCFPSLGTGGVGGGTTRTTSADRNLGNRAADYRRFDISCANGPKFLVEQYVVTTVPAYSMFSETPTDPAGQAAAALTAEMDFIAQHAQLPTQMSAVRLYDHGYIRSVTPVAGGVRFALDRVVPGPAGPENRNPATYDYFLPSSVGRLDSTAIGKVFSIFTNGTSVTHFVTG